ncbi:MAG: adenine nucleotide alpha hydrolase family protein [Nanoarchaeota archaeon]|nr:adenine nucleotide alpha hydrolase family protein [Nanoarchaeota archaeon]
MKEFEEKVRKTIEDYDLLSKQDKALVACSGGKDSTAVLYLLKKFGFNVEGLFIDLLIGDWSEKNLKNVEKFCKELDIKLHVVNVREVLGGSMCYLRSKISKEEKLKTCTVCGVIKRWLLNKKAQELGVDKLVTGHNLDDQVETMLMNFLKNNVKLNIGQQPKTGVVENKKFVPRIKPLFFCLNSEVRKYSEEMKFPVLYEKCPCSSGVFRREIREELEKLEKEYPGFRENIVKNFLEMLPKFKVDVSEVVYCEKCGEVSRGGLCKFCKLRGSLEMSETFQGKVSERTKKS